MRAPPNATAYQASVGRVTEVPVWDTPELPLGAGWTAAVSLEHGWARDPSVGYPVSLEFFDQDAKQGVSHRLRYGALAIDVERGPALPDFGLFDVVGKGQVVDVIASGVDLGFRVLATVIGDRGESVRSGVQ